MEAPLVVLGGSNFAEEAADIAEAAGYRVTAFAADEERLAELAPLAADHRALCAETLTPVRRQLARGATRLGFPFATVIHPSAVVSPSAEVGAGSLLLPHVVVGQRARLGEHTLLNRGALLGAQTTLADYVTLGPGANVADGVSVGEGVLIGIGAVVLDGRRVGRNSVVGSGALVTADVPERVQVLGVPAAIVKRA